MLDLNEGKKAVIFARNVVEDYVKNYTTPDSNLTGVFHQNQGAFVTIHTYPDHNLRGCIGIPLPIMPLMKAIEEGAKVQPFVEDVKVNIDREQLRAKRNQYDYVTLLGNMLKVWLKIKYKDTVVISELKYIEELDYPLMFLEKIEK